MALEDYSLANERHSPLFMINILFDLKLFFTRIQHGSSLGVRKIISLHLQKMQLMDKSTFYTKTFKVHTVHVKEPGDRNIKHAKFFT